MQTEQQALDSLDAYGHLNWVIGDEDNLACFDYAIYQDDKGNYGVAFHCVIDSDPGGFIMALMPVECVPISDAVDYAHWLVDQALDWYSLCEPLDEHSLTTSFPDVLAVDIASL